MNKLFAAIFYLSLTDMRKKNNDFTGITSIIYSF